MSAMRWIAICLITLVWAAGAVTGLWCVFTDDLLARHAGFAGIDAAGLGAEAGALYAALTDAMGAGLLLASFLSAFPLFGPARRGATGPFTALALGHGALWGYFAFTAWNANSQAGMNAPAAALIAVPVLCALAVVFWAFGSGRRSRFSSSRF